MTSSPEHFTANDAIAWSKCERRAWYDLHEKERGLPPERFDQLILEAGQAHEASILDKYQEFVRAKSPDHTVELIEKRTPVIYQPQFHRQDLKLVAQPDFLLLNKDSYRVADAKLAQSIRRKKDIQTQIATYQLAADTSEPALALLPGDVVEEIETTAIDLAWEFIRSMQALMKMDTPPNEDFVASRCGQCPYRDLCMPEFQRSKNLGLDYFVDRRSIPHLNSLGIQDLDDLARTKASRLADGPYFKGVRKRKARLQAESYLTGKVFKLAEPSIPSGNLIHFDVETWPLRPDGKSDVYLWGFLIPPYDHDSYEYVWSDGSTDGDKAAWHDCIQLLRRYREDFPNCLLVHYSNYEVIQIREYAKRYEDIGNDTVNWLMDRDGPMFDLRRTVVESLVLPLRSYGLKDICKSRDLVNFQWELQESGSQWSVVRYYDYLRTDDLDEKESIKSELLSYNHDDVRATLALQEWLETFVEK